MPIVIASGLDPDSFCLSLKQNIKTIGAAEAFGLGDLVVVYSGPSDYVRGKITTAFTGNWQKSREQAKDEGGRRIDDTKIGIFLVNANLQP